MKHDFEGALDEFVAEFDNSYEYFGTIQLALRIADRLQKGVVSDKMNRMGWNSQHPDRLFKAMSQQLIKEEKKMPMCDEMCNKCGTTEGVCMVYGLCDACKNPSRGMKLVPIEPYESMINKIWAKNVTICRNRSKEVYKTMTSKCPTVEVVESKTPCADMLKTVYDKCPDYACDRLKKIGSIVSQILDEYMIENGYKIIKETEQ